MELAKKKTEEVVVNNETVEAIEAVRAAQYVMIKNIQLFNEKKLCGTVSIPMRVAIKDGDLSSAASALKSILNSTLLFAVSALKSILNSTKNYYDEFGKIYNINFDGVENAIDEIIRKTDYKNPQEIKEIADIIRYIYENIAVELNKEEKSWWQSIKDLFS